MHSIEIRIDDREQPSGLPEALRRLGRAPIVCRLPLGDVAIGDRFLIERKRLADLAASLRDGRLEQQLVRLVGEQKGGGPRPLFLVEGPLDAADLSGIDLGELHQAILSIQLDWRLAVIRTADPAESARWIDQLARRAETGRAPLAGHFQSIVASPGGPPPGSARRRPPVRTADRLQLAALSHVAGLGPAKAQLLLDHFGSIQNIRRAGERAWLTVPGVGPSIARALRQFFDPPRRTG
jgi:ERCC4-type nuclease